MTKAQSRGSSQHRKSSLLALDKIMDQQTRYSYTTDRARLIFEARLLPCVKGSRLPNFRQAVYCRRPRACAARWRVGSAPGEGMLHDRRASFLTTRFCFDGRFSAWFGNAVCQGVNAGVVTQTEIQREVFINGFAEGAFVELSQ